MYMYYLAFFVLLWQYSAVTKVLCTFFKLFVLCCCYLKKNYAVAFLYCCDYMCSAITRAICSMLVMLQ